MNDTVRDSKGNALVGEGSRLGLGSALLVTWTLLALVNGVFIAQIHSKASPATRSWQYFFDAAQLIAAGAVSSTLVRTWARYGPKQAVWRWLMLWALGAAFAWGFLAEDYANFADRIGKERWGETLHFAMLLASSPVVVLAAAVGARLARPGFRWLGVVVALGAAIANNKLLPNDYGGVHLFVVLGSSTLMGTSLWGTSVPESLERHAGRRPLLVLNAAIFALSAVALVIPPRALVQSEMTRIEGSVIAPILAKIRVFARGKVKVPEAQAAWFRSRKDLPAIPASTPRVGPPAPIVLLVTVDSMRADLFQAKKPWKGLSRLEKIRAQALDFTTARSPGSRTLMTWSYVFTGNYYTGIEWHGINVRRDPSERFPALLAKAGIPSVNFMSCDQLGKGNLREGFTEEIPISARRGQPFATSKEVLPKMIARLSEQGPEPLFAFAHLMDPHYPYDSVTRKGSSFNRYLAEVAQASDNIGALWDALEAHGLLDRTILIVSADHGEGLGQHGTRYHTVTLYDELLRVPLFVRVPGVAPRRIEEPVTLMDLGPTVLDLFGVATPGRWLGQSLTPFMRGQTPRLTRPIAAERYSTQALVAGQYKTLFNRYSGNREIYDLLRDPRETKNLIEELGPKSDELLDLMNLFFDAHALN